MQSPLSELCLAMYLPFPVAFLLLGAPVASLSSCRFLALKRESLFLLLEMSLGHQLQLLVAKCRFPTFSNLHLLQTLQYAVSRSVSRTWIVQQSLVWSSPPSGVVERAVQYGNARCELGHGEAIECRGSTVYPLLAWAVGYAGLLLDRNQVGHDGRRTYERMNEKIRH